MKVNIFRVGRWAEAALIALWVIGCLNDFIFLQAWRAEGLILIYMIAFTAVGPAVIMLGAWGIGKGLRHFMGIRRGKDFRERPADVFN